MAPCLRALASMSTVPPYAEDGLSSTCVDGCAAAAERRESRWVPPASRHTLDEDTAGGGRTAAASVADCFGVDARRRPGVLRVGTALRVWTVCRQQFRGSSPHASSGFATRGVSCIDSGVWTWLDGGLGGCLGVDSMPTLFREPGLEQHLLSLYLGVAACVAAG